MPRTLSIASVEDLRGHVIVAGSGLPILPDPDIGTGAQVTGRVLHADGRPVEGAQIK